MISEHIEQSEPSPQPTVSKREVVSAIVDRIKRYNSDIDPRSETFRAAVLLLSASEFGHNIDVLARCTGFDRSFVARCARRLIDNGVWVGGSTVADWSSADEASGTFWNDVAVAEGKMCRRIVNGAVEWAPAGFWNKNFHFSDPEADARVGTQYFDALPPPPAPAPVGGEALAEPELIGESVPAEGDARDDDAAGEEVEAEQTSGPAPQGGPPVPPLDHVFHDVIWIG